MSSVWVEPRHSGGKKTWLIRWRSPRLHVSGSEICYSSTDAADFATKQRSRLRRQELGLEPLTAPADPPMTVSAFLDHYARYSEREKSANTWQCHDRPLIKSLRKHLKPNALLAHVTPKMLQDWNHSQSERYNPTTRRMLIIALRALFNYAVRMKMLQESPAAGILPPIAEAGGRALDDSEIRELLGRAPRELRETGIFALNTGLRLREVCGKLDWSLVELVPRGRGRPVLLRQALGKNAALLERAHWFGRIPAGQRKTRRTVTKDCRFPINAAARAVMGSPRASGAVFPVSPSTIQHQIVAVRTAAGLPEDISFHSFRHTFATRYLARGGHIEDLLETKTWASYQALLRYVHVNDDVLASRFGGLDYPNCPPGAHRGGRSGGGAGAGANRRSV